MKINIKKVGINLVFISLFFLTSFNGTGNEGFFEMIIKHFDEALVILFTLFCILNYKFLYKRKKKLMNAWFLFLGFGLLSSTVYHYQSITITLMDMFVIINKFFVGYLFTYYFSIHLQHDISDYIFKSSKIILIILFVLSINDFFFSPIFPKGDYRYFTYSLKLMFTHPTYLAAAAITLLIYFGYMSRKQKVLPYMIIASIVASFTLRSKTLGFLFIYWALYIFIFKFKFKHFMFLAFTGIPAVLFIGSEQITTYFFDARYSPRAILLKDSFKLAARHFPLGSGFGTFGSPLAAQYYSPLYSMLGYSNNYGMSRDYSVFLNDSFWPIILAQFGFFGLILFLYIITLFIKIGLNKYKINKYAGFAIFITIVNMIINSLGESSFFNQASLILFMLLAVYESE